MSLFSSGFKLIKKSAALGSKLGKIPILGSVMKAVPGLGMAMAAADMVSTGMDIAKGLGGGMGGAGGKLVPLSKAAANGMMLTALPGVMSNNFSGGGGPAYAARTVGSTGSTPAGTPRGGGKRLDQLTLAELQAMEAAGERIPASQLKTYHKSPVKGYVVMTVNGGVHCLRKDVARHFGWKPGHKPPISVGQYQAIKKASKAVDKFHHIEKETAKLMHFKQHMARHHQRQLPPGVKNIIIEKRK